MAKSKLEETFAFQLRAAGIPFLRGVRAIPGRKLEWDFQVKDLLIEIQGGTRQRPVMINGTWYIPVSGHNSMAGVRRDSEKLDLATLHRYYSMSFTAEHIESGQALKWVQQWRR